MKRFIAGGSLLFLTGCASYNSSQEYLRISQDRSLLPEQRQQAYDMYKVKNRAFWEDLSLALFIVGGAIGGGIGGYYPAPRTVIYTTPTNCTGSSTNGNIQFYCW